MGTNSRQKETISTDKTSNSSIYMLLFMFSCMTLNQIIFRMTYLCKTNQLITIVKDH